MKQIKRLLIANRGEIACRIIKTAKQLGMTSIAIYSEADAKAKHVANADEAYCVGQAASSESYLQTTKIIELAKTQAVDAIHPGYGFLSENADFAKACFDANIMFVGPSPEAITAMGNKDTAKAIMQQAGVPTVPGYQGDEQAPEQLHTQAQAIGYPVLLKAVAGGGGKGMRIVTNDDEFMAALAAAKREAKASFNNDRMLIEKYIAQPRHIELQIFADTKGNTVHLFERDCSVQRRYQKVVEEAPAPHLPDNIRQAMGKAAITAAKAIHYTGAGTVEFLLDADHNFYFMEMNTRLQVEHPVTEMITQQDLVAWQLAIAEGKPLPLQQTDIKKHGAAIEVRIYAEDPFHEFLPAIGQIDYLQEPNDCRIDSAVRQHDSISPYYDPMIAKLIVWGETRQIALDKLRHGLSHYYLIGIKTNIPFLQAIAQQAAFQSGNYDTGFIKAHEAALLTPPSVNDKTLIIAALFVLQQAKAQVTSDDPWQQVDSWRANLPHEYVLRFRHNKDDYRIICEIANNGYLLHIGDNDYWLDQTDTAATLDANVFQFDQSLTIFSEETLYQLQLVDLDHGGDHNDADQDALNAPMPGTIIAMLAEAGQAVKRGTPLLIMEAMKMEHVIKAPMDGSVTEFHFSIGDQVNEGSQLLAFRGDE